MVRACWVECRGNRLAARGAEQVSEASVKAAVQLASSPGVLTEGRGVKGGIDGRLEQLVPEQGRRFPE